MFSIRVMSSAGDGEPAMMTEFPLSGAGAGSVDGCAASFRDFASTAEGCAALRALEAHLRADGSLPPSGECIDELFDVPNVSRGAVWPTPAVAQVPPPPAWVLPPLAALHVPHE